MLITLTQDDLTWDSSTLLPGADVVGALRDLKARPGRDLQVMGSVSVARLLAEHDLVDEYQIMLGRFSSAAGSASSPRTTRRGPWSWSDPPWRPPA